MSTHKFIDEVLNLPIGNKDTKQKLKYLSLWYSPGLAGYFDDRIKHLLNNPRRPFDVNSTFNDCNEEHKIFKDILDCDTCLQYAMYHRGIMQSLSPEILLELTDSSSEPYMFPAIWGLIKNNEKEQKRILRNQQRFMHLCYNSLALPFIENHPERIDDICRKILLRNEAASDMVIKLKFSQKEIMGHGSANPNLYPYFDHQECEDVITGAKYDEPMLLGYMHNSATVDMFTKYFDAMINIYPERLVARLAGSKHFLPLVTSHMNYFSKIDDALMFLNSSSWALKYLKDNPTYIVMKHIIKNPGAKDIIEEYLLDKIKAGQKIPEDELVNVNRNQAMVPFLRAHPNLINHHILNNNNVTEPIGV